MDKGRNDSCIFWNGGGSGFWDTSRQLTPAEAGLTEMTLRIDYDGTDTLSAYLNDIFVASQSGVVLPGGYFGLNTFYSDVTYHSAMLTEYPEESNFVSNLSDLTYTGGQWTETKDGLRATMSSDAFAIAGENINGPFVFEGDMTMISGVAMGVIFQAQSENPGATGGYCINFDLSTGALAQQFRIFEYPWQGSLVSDLAKNRFVEAGITPEVGKTYHFKLQYNDGKISYTFGGVEIFNEIVDLDTTQLYTNGRVGVMGHNAIVQFQNLQLTTGSWDAELSNLSVESSIAQYDDSQNFYFLVEDGTDLTNIAPTFQLSDGAVCDKASGQAQDFSQPVTYLVTAANGTQKEYTVTIFTPSTASAADKEAAAAIEEQIDSLPEIVTPANKEDILEVYDAYEALSPIQKLLVSNRSILLEKTEQAQRLTQPIRVLCVGDSITEGYGSSDFNRYSYPAQLQQILGDDYLVYNAGVGGSNAIDGGQLSYRKVDRYELGKAFDPDIVILMLGTNDGIDWVWENEGYKFKGDYTALAQEYMNLPSQPKVFLALPMTSYGAEPQKTYIHEEIVPTIEEIGQELGLDVIDMHSFSAGHPEWFPDTIHPNDGAYTLIAEEFAKYIRGLASAELASISLDGEALADFSSDDYSYDIVLDRGESMPEITATATSKDAQINITTSSDTLPATVTISVTSGDYRGYQEYVLHFSETAQTLQEAADAAKQALSQYEATNETTADDLMALVAGCIENELISAQWTEDFALTEATATQPGSITGVITLTLNGESIEIPVQLAIPALGGGEPPEEPNQPDEHPSIPGGSESDWHWPDTDGQDNQHTTSGDKENPVTGDIAYPIVAMVLLLGAATAVTLTRRK